MITENEFLNDLKRLIFFEGELRLDMDLLDIDEWDSYSAMSFIEMVQAKYGKKIEPFSVAEAVLIEDLYQLI